MATEADGRITIDAGIAVEALGGLSNEIASVLAKEFEKAMGRAGIDKALIKAISQDLSSRATPKLRSVVRNFSESLVKEFGKAGTKMGEALGDKAILAAQTRLTKGQVKLQREVNEAIRTIETEATKRVESTNRTARQKAAIEAPAKLAAATAKATEATAKFKSANDALRLSLDKTEREEKRVEQRRISLARTQSTIPVRREEVAGRSAVNSLINERTQQEIAARTAIENAKRQRQLDVASAQQDEKRRTLRLQRFNALSLQLTQAGLTKIRDARRNHNNRIITEQVSSDKREERQLRETLSRRQLEVKRFEEKAFRSQRSSTQALLSQRTQTGVLGAARGVTPIGASLRSLALIGGGALSIRAIFNSAQNFLANFRRLGALTGATTAQLEQLRTTAIALGNDLALPGVSAADATESLTRLVQAGFSVDQAIGAAKGTLLLARNNMLDFSEAAQFTGSAINSFGIDASKAVRIVDIAQRSLVSGGGQSFTELSQGIQQAGAVFSQFFSAIRGGQGAFEDMNIALDILAKNGLRGSDAGTSLKTFLLALTGSSTQAQKAIASLGTIIGKTGGEVGGLFFDAAGKVLPFIDIIKNLRESLKDFSQEAKLDFLKKIFGTDAFRAASIFIGQTDEQLTGFTETIRNAAGTSELLGKAVNQGMRAAFDNFGSVVETAGILLVEKIDKPLGKVINQFATLTSNLLQGQGVYSTVRASLAGMAVALGAIFAAKGGVEVLGLLKSTLIGLASPAQLAALGLIAIGGAIGIGIQKSDEFKDSLSNLVGFISTTVLGPLDRLRKSLFGSGGKKPGGGLNDAQRETLPDSRAPAARQTNVVFDAVGRAINNQLIPALETARDFITDTLLPAVQRFARFFITDVVPLFTRIGRLIISVGQLVVSEFLFRIGPTVTTLFDGLKEGFTGLASGAQASGVIGFFQDLARVVGFVGRAATQLFTGNFSDALGTITALGRNIGAALLEAFRNIDYKEIGLTIFKGIGFAARKLGSGLTTIFSEPVLKAILAAAAGVIAVAADIAVNFVIGFAKGLQGRIDDIARVISDVLKIAVPLAFKAAAGAVALAAVGFLKVAISGPLGSVVALIGAAFGVVLFNKIRTSFFQPLAAGSKATFQVLTGNIKEGISGYQQFVRAQQEVVSKATSLKQSLGGGLFASFLVGAKTAVTQLGKLGDTIGPAAAAGVGVYFGAFQGGLAQVISLAGAAALAVQAIVTGNFAAAGIIGGIALVGLLLGKAAKAAKEAKERVDSFTQSLKASTDAEEGFAAGLEAIAQKQKGLAPALESLGVGIGDVLNQLGPGQRFASLNAVNDLVASFSKVRFASGAGIGGFISQIDALGNALPAGDVARLRNAAKAVQTAFDLPGQGADRALALVKALGALDQELTRNQRNFAGSVKNANEFDKTIDSVITSLKQTTPLSALGLAVDKISEAMTKARKEGSSLGPVIAELLPTDLEIQFRRIGIELGDVGDAVRKGGTDFVLFKNSLGQTALQAGLTAPEIGALQTVLDRLELGFLGSTGAVQGFSAATRELARKQQIDKIAGDWDEVTKATDRAKSSLDVYLATLNPPSGQSAADQFLLNTNAALDSIAQLLKDQPGIDLTSIAISGGGQAGAQFRTDIAAIRSQASEFLNALPADILKDKEKASEAIGSAFDEIIISGVLKGIPEETIRSILDEQLANSAAGDFSKAEEAFRTNLGAAIRDGLASGELFDPSQLQLAIPPELLGKVKLPTIIDQVLVNPNVPEEIKAEISRRLKEDPASVNLTVNEILGIPKVINSKLNVTSVTYRGRPFNFSTGLGVPARTAEGGIFAKAQVRSISEGNKPEAVIPLTKPARALSLLRQSGLADLLLGGSIGHISLSSQGHDVGQGLALGLEQSRGAVSQAAAGLADAVSTTFTSLLGIHSPSTVFEKFGKDIIDGLVKGMKEGADAAGDAITKFINIILGRVANGGVNTGTKQLVDALREQLAAALKQTSGDDVRQIVDAQAQALSGIAELVKNKKDFRKGLSLGTAEGAQNRSTLANIIAQARDAIVGDVERGDTASANAVFSQLWKALVGAALQNKKNAPVIGELLAQFGLSGNNPVQEIVAQFEKINQNLADVIAADESRRADAQARNVPLVEQTNNIFGVDPDLVAQRIGRENQTAIKKALRP